MRAVGSTLLASVLLGAVTTALVAGYCVSCSRLEESRVWTRERWPEAVDSDWSNWTQCRTTAGFGIKQEEFDKSCVIVMNPKSFVEELNIKRWYVGWPCHALSARLRYETPHYFSARRNDPAITVHDGILVLPQRWQGSGRVLPYRPVLRGFLIDVSVYSGALLCLTWGTRGVRRLARGMRGECRSCGYDRRGLAADAKCPECGTVPAPTPTK
jgi:hypothetical protein